MDIELGDDNQENIEVSYSTHLRERENVQKLLKDHSQSRIKTLEAKATPTATKTSFFDNLETPVIRKVVEDETPILNRVLESEKSEFIASQKDIKFNGNTSGLSEMSEENLNQSSLNEPQDLDGSDIQDGSPANFSKFAFNRTGGTGLDRSEIDEDFARLKIEGDTLKNSFEDAGITEKLSKELLEPITGESLSRK